MNPINLRKFILQKKVGSGSFGDVFKIKEIDTGKFYAAKMSQQKIDENSEEMAKDILREVEIISKLDHPSVLNFIGFSPHNFKKKPKPIIITEYVSNGNLEDLINSERNGNKNVHWNDTQKLITIYGIASAMSYLHTHNIIHRDLKPENILMDDFLFPKIADFGLSIICSGATNIDFKTTTASIRGTPCYISPEIWEKSEYTNACDIYAFAITVYEIMTTEKPFAKFGFFEIPLKVKNGYRPEFKKKIPPSYQNLIERCWAQDINDRPSFREILKDLKSDPGFITETVDKKAFENYISLIEDVRVSFNSRSISMRVDGKFNKIIIDKDTKEEKKNIMKERIEHPLYIFPFDDFIELDEDCKILIEDAEKDRSKFLSIAKSLIEGRDNFQPNAKAGMKYLLESITDENEEALIYYCEMLINGDIIPRNLKKAKKTLKNKSFIEESNKNLLYGKIYSKEKEYDKAKNCFFESLNKGNSEALYEYGKMLFKDYGCSIDKEEATKYIQKSIEKGCVKAMYKYGLFLLSNNNKVESVQYIKMAADKGYTKAMYTYGLILESSEKDSTIAMKYFVDAANAGHVDSMLKCGIKLSQCQDDNINKEKGAKYLKKASDKGDLSAMYYYGLSLYEKDENPKNLRDAARYIKISADNGNSEAMAQYGMMLIRGRGISVDYENAVKYLEKSVDKQKNPDALFGLAYLYETGKGVEKDPIKAQNYYKLSAKYKSSDAFLKLGNDYFDGTTNGVNTKIAKFCFLTCIQLIKDNYVNAAKAVENSYRSNGNLGLIDILAFRDPKNAKIHFREAALCGYPFAQNNYGFLSQFYFNDKEEAEKMFIEASKINYSFSEYNLGYLYEDKGDIQKAIEFYKLASEHEREPLVFRRQTIYDDSVELSKFLIVCLANFKLVHYYLSINNYNFKKYFIKALLNIAMFIQNYKDLFKNDIDNNDEVKMFIFFRNSVLNFLNEFPIDKSELDSFRFNSVEIDECDIEKILDLIESTNDNLLIKFNPKHLFKVISNSPENYQRFFEIITETIKKMKEVLYNPPYYVFFGQILFKNNVANQKSESFINDSYHKFLSELGYE